MSNELEMHFADADAADIMGDDRASGSVGDPAGMNTMAAVDAGDDDEELSPMQAALRLTDADHRGKEMAEIAAKDMSIDGYTVEPATTQCLTDFATLEDPAPEDIEGWDCGEGAKGVAPEELPLHYYDNDDGFWDDYIKYKRDRWENADGGMITNR